jgi:hypothetical protein
MMQAMAKEMMKAGLIEEMVDDVMEDVGGAEEEDVDGEVQRVLQEVAGETLAKLPQAGAARAEAEKASTKTEEVRLAARGQRCHMHRGCCAIAVRVGEPRLTEDASDMLSTFVCQHLAVGGAMLPPGYARWHDGTLPG